MNLAEGRWDPELCALFGVPIECLPEIRDTVGHFGVIGNTPLTASVVDQQASLYGHGCRQPGDAKITFGTGAFALTLSGERIIRSPETGLLATIAWQIDGKPVYAMDGGVYDASAAVEWAGRLGLFSDFSELAGFDRPPAIDRGLAFVPALSGLACPHWDRSAGAMWLGMDAGTRREDLCQALLEGVVLRSAEVIQAMDGYLKVTDRLSIDGGLARSPYFAQFLADSLQRRIVTQRFDELTAFGCAALAARGLGYELAEPRTPARSSSRGSTPAPPGAGRCVSAKRWRAPAAGAEPLSASRPAGLAQRRQERLPFSAGTSRPSSVRMSSPASSTLTMASSTASAAAANNGEMWSLLSIRSGVLCQVACAHSRLAAGPGCRWRGEEHVATGVLGTAAGASDADRGALRQALALVRQQRRVGGQDHHDGAHTRGAFLAERRGDVASRRPTG